jgi:hypothetical protein
MKQLLTLLTIVLFFLGCTKNIPTLQERKATALSLAQSQNLQEKIYSTTNFNLFALQTDMKECQNITLYIEGDGLAWITRSKVSSDPTPINPLALNLMNVDNSSCKIYLARPCQYIDSKMCEKKYWTSHRFNTKVIESYNQALDMIKKEYSNKTFSLVGYSGGAAVALLTAAKREDIKDITTVAGNINPHYWSEYHNISPLSGSLNPVNYTQKLENIEQYHLIGNQDSIIPKAIFDSYKRSFNNSSNIYYKLYDASHIKNWEQNYRNFLKEKK